MSENSNEVPSQPGANALSSLVISLLKGVLYLENDLLLWNALIQLQSRVRDHIAVLGLELVLDEAEGYAFLRARPEVESEENNSDGKLPRLIARRPLSFPISLLLALLRKKLAEFDASGEQTRLILARDEIVELLRLFLPESSNEARLIDQIDTHINKIVDLGFLRRLKPVAGGGAAGGGNFEVRRILKAFVDAQWLAEFDARLDEYRTQLIAATDTSESKNE
jgi:hypothetical protein